MKLNKTQFVSLKHLALATLLSLMFSPILMAATWTMEAGSGECYKDDKRVGGADYCNNCKKQQGNQVKWQFPANCDGRLAGHLAATLSCGTSVPSEGEQLRLLQAEAARSLPPATQNCP